ncbi:Redoxin-domain-containing protein [Lenzites betulinus]|nr:Redoxin-domain-containing protein [Lenzites betulinus]KAH9848206.1 Redoxin-domain-containing protein [Lenzites betulinus]
MASVLASATKTAHSLATSLLSAAEAKVGATIPTNVHIKEDDASAPFTLAAITGKNVFVGVPGAFTGTCSAQIPAYIKNFDQFKAKGVDGVYVVGVNDVFVMKAWKEQLAPQGTPIHFIADDQAAFVGALGMLFDASELLGAPRSKRFVAVTEGETITYLAVEPVPGEVTVTAADKILARASRYAGRGSHRQIELLGIFKIPQDTTPIVEEHVAGADVAMDPADEEQDLSCLHPGLRRLSPHTLPRRSTPSPLSIPLHAAKGTARVALSALHDGGSDRIAPPRCDYNASDMRAVLDPAKRSGTGCEPQVRGYPVRAIRTHEEEEER